MPVNILDRPRGQMIDQFVVLNRQTMIPLPPADYQYHGHRC